jgi:hypothetical protein
MCQCHTSVPIILPDEFELATLAAIALRTRALATEQRRFVSNSRSTWDDLSESLAAEMTSSARRALVPPVELCSRNDTSPRQYLQALDQALAHIRERMGAFSDPFLIASLDYLKHQRGPATIHRKARAPSLFHPRVSKVIVCADLRGE